PTHSFFHGVQGTSDPRPQAALRVGRTLEQLLLDTRLRSCIERHARSPPKHAPANCVPESRTNGRGAPLRPAPPRRSVWPEQLGVLTDSRTRGRLDQIACLRTALRQRRTGQPNAR